MSNSERVWFYSPATGGFYHKPPGAAGLPDDCAEVTPEQRQGIITAQAAQQRVVVSDGVVSFEDVPDVLQRRAARRLSRECEAEISEGFTHAGKQYPYTRDDQANLLALALVGSGGPVKSADGYVDHSADEVRAVLAAGVAHLNAARSNLSAKRDAAAKSSKPESIKWR